MVTLNVKILASMHNRGECASFLLTAVTKCSKTSGDVKVFDFGLAKGLKPNLKTNWRNV
jgi:hypothetical protein